MLVVICWNVIDNWIHIEKLLAAIVFVMFIASILGVLSFSSELFRFKFKSLMGFILPGAIADTGYGGVIAIRNVGFYNWFIGLGEYFRVSSFFLYSTMFSSTLAIILPVAMFLRKINLGFRRKYFTFVIFFMSLALLATTGRVAILAILISYFIFKFLSIKSFEIRFSIISFLLLLFSFLLFWLEQSGILYQIIDLALYSRGEGSATTRYKIYVKTFQGFLERPIFGWGTERDVKGLAYPLGSHSYYLGTLYKQGILGLILFCSILLSVWRNVKINNGINIKTALFFRYGQYMLLVFMLNSFTDVLDLDATTMIFFWLVVSLLLVSKRIEVMNK